MSLGELIDRVMTLLGCDADAAFKVAQEVYSPGRDDYSDDVLRYAANAVGVGEDEGEEPVQTAPEMMPEMTMDPVEVLRQVYLACPRCVPADEDGKVHVPRIGRAPQEEQHAIPQEILDELPDHVKLLLMQIDVFNAEANVVFYDEANGVDRRMPAIDLTRYGSGEDLRAGIDALLSRIQRVVAADWN